MKAPSLTRKIRPTLLPALQHPGAILTPGSYPSSSFGTMDFSTEQAFKKRGVKYEARKKEMRDTETTIQRKKRKKNVVQFEECKTADYPNLLFSPLLLLLLLLPVTDSGEAQNNADYHNCFKCV
ncbi:unnamed protein product [Xyrichtys novacula]|uniref:Unnamed protein product n=1 Tax=Xyrichtys novacula TaxID=13765 RepID=A0AAV1EYG9_XYRNO|nr:unnamed protein product [Xyrichtys novacula]